MNKPLITIQCGNYSNYIGSHFWNIQESGFVYKQNNVDGRRIDSAAEILEIDNDVLYREGSTLDREVTYTPRLLVVDLKGSLGTLPESGELYEKISIPKEDTLALHWSGGHQVFREEPLQKNEFLSDFEKNSENALSEKDVDDISADDGEDGSSEKLYDLEGSVNCWSDYLGARYHPRSVLLCQTYQHDNPTHPFDAWGLGREVWSDFSALGENLEDRIRSYAEECDNLGGFQVVCDWQDGFGGLSAELVELVSDEYHSKSLLSFPTAPVHHSSWSAPHCGARLAGAVLTLSRHLTSSSSSLVTPLSVVQDWYPLSGQLTRLPHLTTGLSHYSTSSLLALALDTATATYRRRTNLPAPQLSPAELSAGLSCQGRRVASLAAEVPLQISENKITEYFESSPLSRLTPLLPGHRAGQCEARQWDYSAVVTVRGLKISSVYARRSPQFLPCPSPSSYLQTAINNSQPTCRPACAFFTKPVSTGKPFPHIFNKTVSCLGELSDQERAENLGVMFSTAMTSWETGPAAQSSLQCLLARGLKLSLAKLHRLTESGLEEEEWKEALESLTQHSELYSDGT